MNVCHRIVIIWRRSIIIYGLVLPLENHSLCVPITIYNTKSSKPITTQLICLSYCGLRTLTAQIHEVLRDRNQNEDIRYEIDLYSVQYNHRNHRNALVDPYQILKPVDVSQKCEYLVGKSVLAVAKRWDDMKESDA
eukprot:407825_1